MHKTIYVYFIFIYKCMCMCLCVCVCVNGSELVIQTRRVISNVHLMIPFYPSTETIDRPRRRFASLTYFILLLWIFFFTSLAKIIDAAADSRRLIVVAVFQLSCTYKVLWDVIARDSAGLIAWLEPQQYQFFTTLLYLHNNNIYLTP